MLLVLSIPDIILYFSQMYDYRNIFAILFIFPTSTIISLIIYFLPDPVFRGWSWFALWWVPLQMILVAITPSSNPGAFIDIVTQQTMAIFLSALFALISLVIVIWKYFSSRRAASQTSI